MWFGVGSVHENLWGDLNFGLYRNNMIFIFRECQTNLDKFNKKVS